MPRFVPLDPRDPRLLDLPPLAEVDIQAPLTPPERSKVEPGRRYRVVRRARAAARPGQAALGA